MSPGKRAFLRWSFIATFLIVTPAVILTTAGYRYNFSRNRIERTGVLVFDSAPSGATVYVNDRVIKNVTPARLTRALPGAYTVRMEKAGYRPWSREVSIASGGTTFVNDVVLFRETLPTMEAETSLSETVAFSPSGRYAAALSESGPETEVTVVDIKDGVSTLVYRTPTVTETGAAFSWSIDDQLLMRRNGPKDGSEFFAWSPGRSSMQPLSAIKPGRWQQALWGQDDGILYAADAVSLHEIDLANGKARTIGPAADELTVSNRVAYAQAQEADGVAILHRPLNGGAFASVHKLAPGQYRLIPHPGTLLTFTDASDYGRLYIIDPTKGGQDGIVFDGPGAKHGAWSEDGKRLLYWTRSELRVFDAEKRTDDLITRVSATIQDADRYADGELVLFGSGNAAYAVETGHEGNRALTKLTEFDALYGLTVAKNGEAAWFAGTIGRQSGIWSLRLR